MQPPTFADIERARTTLSAHWPRTPLLRSHALSRMAGCDVFLKMECWSPIGSFKGRGVMNRLAQLTPSERTRGVITASTGNQGWALAWAAQQVGAAATVVLPEGVPAIKRDAIADAGARIVVAGRNWNESCVSARQLAARDGLLYLEDGDDPAIMAGAGTIALEVLEDCPTMDALLVPVGGGNLIAGCAIAAKHLRPSARVIGVQSEAAPGVYQSWQRGEPVSAECHTLAGGMATTGPVESAFRVMQRRVDAMRLVSEDELMRAIALAAQHHALIVEGAGAAPLAALLRYRDEFAGQQVVLLVTGRNLDVDTLARALEFAR